MPSLFPPILRNRDRIRSAPQLHTSTNTTQQPVCSVCYNNITKMRPAFKNRCKCKHTFCKHCIMSWIVTKHNSCPTCRIKIFTQKSCERIQHIHAIYTRNAAKPTQQSINNLVQFFENIEHKRRPSVFKRKLTRLPPINYRYYNNRSFPYYH